MDKFKHTTADLAAELGTTPKTIRKWAAELGIGIDRSGRAGFVYTDAERNRLIESRRPIQKPVPRQRKKKAA